MVCKVKEMIQVPWLGAESNTVDDEKEAWKVIPAVVDQSGTCRGARVRSDTVGRAAVADRDRTGDSGSSSQGRARSSVAVG